MEWPQVVMIILLTLKVVASVCWHGKATTISCVRGFINVSVLTVVLYAGGFWM